MSPAVTALALLLSGQQHHHSASINTPSHTVEGLLMFTAVIREDLIAENSPLNHIAIRKTFSGVLRFAYYDSCLPKRCRTNETWFGLSSVITCCV